MKRCLPVILVLLFTLNAKAQIYLNIGVDTSGTDVQKALGFYNSYVAAFKNKKIPEMSAYWPASELAKRKLPDQLLYGINMYPIYSQGYTLSILYVKPTDKYVQIKTQFSYIDSLKNITTLCITNHYVAFDQSKKPYFIAPLTINTAVWKTQKVRNVTFYYPPYHQFNKVKADSLCSRLAQLEKDWSLSPIPLTYYLADTYDELIKVKGFDLSILMGNRDKPSGMSDDKDNQVFCGGLGENYFHEVAHLYLNHLYPNSPLQEGLVVSMAGSMGHQVNWHLKRVNTYLQQHPKADLNQLEDFWYTDPYTNPGSAIDGMICNIVYKKDGIAGLKRIMAYTSYNDVFEKEFHIQKGQWDVYLRKTIKEQSEMAR